MSRRRGIRMPGSLLVYLLCLSLLPMAGFAAYAGLLTWQAVQQAHVAQGIEVGMRRVAAVERLRAAITEEVLVAGVQATGTANGLSLGSAPTLGVPSEAQARAQTEAALAALARDSRTAAVAASIARARTAILARIDHQSRSGSTPTVSQIVTGYRGLDNQVVELEMRAGAQVSIAGGYGRASAALAVAAAQVNAATLVVVQSDNRVAQLYQVFYQAVTPNASPSALASALRQLQAVDGAYQATLASSAPLLVGDIGARWEEILGSTDAKLLETEITEILTDPMAVSELSVGEGAAIQDSTLNVYQAQNALLAEAVSQGGSAAAAERTRAIRHARTVVIVSVGLLLLALVLLVAFSRVIHRAFGELRAALEERQRLQEDLAHAASHDALTGLPNRTAAEELLLAALQEAGRGGEPLALLFVDLDHFKAVNDTHGHAAGDHVLQVVAARMTGEARVQDTVCRLGGDEFVVVLRGTHEQATAMGGRIVRAVTEPIAWDGQKLRVGASVGVAVRDAAETTVDDLLIRADRAVYRAKAAGRGLVRS